MAGFITGQVKYAEFKSLKHLVQKEIRSAYWSYTNNLIAPEEHPHSNQKRFWSYIKALRRENTNIPVLNYNGSSHESSLDKAEVLNQQFQSVFTKEPNSPLPDKGFSPYPTMCNINISVEGIYNLLLNINPHKACGPDQIHGRVLKETADVIAPFLQTLFQSSLDSGVIPDDWRSANITPIFKQGDRQQPSNYRPISLTSIVSKLFEQIINSNIMKHLETNNILTDHQYGFRHSRSCETLLITLLHDLSRCYDTGIQTDIIFTDFAKAFDTVPHQRLLYKLDWYGIRGGLKDWVSSFLNCRTQCVVLDGVSSSRCPVLSGVPQGTVLGPTLFSIYINDLPESILHGSIKLFADDCIIYKAIRAPEDTEKLQEDLCALQEWQERWLMRLNVSKCFTMNVLHPRRNKIITHYKLHNHLLSPVEHYKYLGIIIQNDLKWHLHIQSITSKANQMLGLLKRNLRTPFMHLRERAYLSLVRPKLEYATTVWSPHLTTDKIALEKIQRRGARYVKGIYTYDASVTQMVNELQWESLESRREQLSLTMLYNILKQNTYLPPEYIPQFHLQTSLQTRSCHPFRLTEVFCNTDIYKYSFIPLTSGQWNLLPCYILESDTVNTFKLTLRNHYFAINS